MGKKGGNEQRVTDYYMSLHYGIASGPAKLLELKMADKVMWKGQLERPTAIGINEPQLFGGKKSEGGAIGMAQFFPGGPDQKMTTFLAQKYGRSRSTMTGYRYISSFALTELAPSSALLEDMDLVGNPTGPSRRAGFDYSSNSPYLRDVSAKISRIFTGWKSDKAAIDHQKYGSVSPMAIYFLIDQEFSILTAAYDGMRLGMVAALDAIKDYKTRNADTRFDFGATLVNSQFFPNTDNGHIAYHDITLEQIEEAKTWCLTHTRVNGGTSYRKGYENMMRFFTTTVKDFIDGDPDADVFSRRVAILPCNNNHFFQHFLDAGKHFNVDIFGHDFGEDIQDQSTGTYQTGRYSQVDCYTIDYSHSQYEIDHPGDFSFVDTFRNQPRYPSLKFDDNQGLINQVLDMIRPKSNEPDMNPAHIIYECLTNADWGMGAPTTMLDLDSFSAAADTLFTEELGLSMMWAQQSSIETFIQEVINHIQATLFVNPANGLITIKLVRGDYDPDSLAVLDKDNCNVTSFQRKLLGETVNEIVATWTNPINEQSETVTAQDNANISIQGGIVSDSRNYYGVRSAELATFLAWRDLASASAPLATVEIEANRKAWNFVPGGVVKLSYPEYGIDSMILRIGQIDYGKPGDPTIKLNCVEDVFGLDIVAYTNPQKTIWTPPTTKPKPADNVDIFTLNYFFAINLLPANTLLTVGDTSAFAGILASSSAVDCFAYSLLDLTTGEYKDKGQRDIVARTLLPVPVAREAVSNIDFTGAAWTTGQKPQPGAFLIVGENYREYWQEIMLITAVSGDTVTVKRGLLDTVPADWNAGVPVWVITDQTDFVDTTARTVGEEPDFRICTITNQGILFDQDSPDYIEAVTDRAWCPTRPANVKVNGQGFGVVDITGIDPVPVTWSLRNRTKEDAVIMNWTDAGVLPEPGQLTNVYIYADNGVDLINQYLGVTGESLSIDAADFTASRAIVRVESQLDDKHSWESYRLPVTKDAGTGYGDGYGYSYGEA